MLSEDHIIQNNSGKAIGNIQSQVTINNQFPEDVLKILIKITNLLESQNKLMEEMLKQRSK